MASLGDIVEYCDKRSGQKEIPDYPGAMNGLQVANSGRVAKIGAAVDAGMAPFAQAVAAGVDFLIVHHGLFWDPPRPITDRNYEKLRILFDGDCALYGCHLPLDCHPEIGNNALLAKKLGLQPVGSFHQYEGHPVCLITRSSESRDSLKTLLRKLFSGRITAIEYGSTHPSKVAILTGSGASVVGELKEQGVDTLITGELKQNHFNLAQEDGLNLYLCGHYATETFGVAALAGEVAKEFDLPNEFIATECPL